MPWQGRFLIVVTSLATIAGAARGSLGPGRAPSEATQSAPTTVAITGPTTPTGHLRAPEPTPEEIEKERERWRLIIELICTIIPCDPVDPPTTPTASATLALHARLDRFEVKGLNAGLTKSQLQDGVSNVDELTAMLNGPGWSYLVATTTERDGLLVQLATLRVALIAAGA